MLENYRGVLKTACRNQQEHRNHNQHAQYQSEIWSWDPSDDETEVQTTRANKYKNKRRRERELKNENKVGREINQIRKKDQEELEEVQTSPGSSDHQSQFLLPPSIDFYFNICIPECHPNFSQWCLWKVDSCRTPSYSGRLECSCISTTAFYMHTQFYFREELFMQVQSNSVLTFMKGTEYFASL